MKGFKMIECAFQQVMTDNNYSIIKRHLSSWSKLEYKYHHLRERPKLKQRPCQ